VIVQTFDALLSGRLGTRLSWERAHRCPCTEEFGGADVSCPVCLGKGRYWDTPSADFRAGVVSLTARALAAMQMQFGPGFVGDGTISLPSNCPAWFDVGEGDRFLSLDNQDSVEQVVGAGSVVKLPAGADVVSAYIRQGSTLQAVTPPTPDDQGRVTVARATVLALRVPRRYEVVRAIPQIRGWTPGLPKKVLVRMLDVSTR
jgi:hypothetical protein